MAEVNCSACQEIRETSPEFIVNGLTDDICTSLQNDTGLNPADDHNDCEDLNNLNDCLVGNYATEVEAYDVCDWKEFMRNFIPNLWTTIKGVICSICGIWKAVHRLECLVDFLFQGAEFQFGENTQGKESKVVPGKGADFGIRNAGSQHTVDVTITYIAGGIARVSGSIRTFVESFKDVDGNTKSGNSVWDFEHPDMPKGGELLYEVRIKKSEYPQIKRFFNGNAFPTGGNDHFFQTFIIWFNEGKFAYGQHGWCDDDGTPSEEGYSQGHQVPEGWIYLQLRMLYIGSLDVYNVKDGEGNTKRGTDFTPAGFLGIRMNQAEVGCDDYGYTGYNR